ncbi:hypothetical protein DHW03_10920 [Pedobacter yonginense]|uniref:DUF4129 domain-containing protein n=1 Tax=Pedobacter yonginense TaxID=651869 RepID=A0A317ENC5_9SPHI|nr:hypothetical protein [Pedobacter yonginense]PWS28062.1 hypothetical protein DHW03_10920 [Pedobacter yonginense]
MRLLLALFLFLSAASVHAQTGQKTIVYKKPIAVKIYSTKVELRKIDREAIKTYSKQKDFIYEDAAPETLTWWDKFWNKFWKLIDKLLGNKISGSVLKVVLIAVAIAAVVFIAIKLIGLDFRLLSGKSKSLEVPFEESLENIHEIDFDDQISNALQTQNYRLAVRLLYLKTLKNLSDKQLINWLPDKTNQAYVLEIADEGRRDEFSKLTNQFEYIWYGEFFIDKTTFENVNQSFHDFNLKKA